MGKCPCSKCITYAMCRRSHSIKTLIDKCTIVNDYITSIYRARKVIRVIKPGWYVKPQDEEPTLSEGSSNVFNYSMQVRKERKREKWISAHVKIV